MRINFAFGRKGLPLDLPEPFRYEVLEARYASPLAEPEAAIERALEAPIGCAPLSTLAKNKKSAAISVCDITRPVPNWQILPILLRTIENAGIPRDAITILIATGLHRPATDAEITEICGDFTARNYRVVNHHAHEPGEHRFLGTTQSGTPVYVDERFVAADLHITLGFIEPHLMLGFSGGRKLIAPGLAAEATIKVLHSPRFMRDERAVEGSIEDNPLHRELMEIAGMARHDFMLDVALARSEGRGPRPIAAVFAGDPVQAHNRGIQFVSQGMLHLLENPVDAVITTSAGYPLDLTFYQAIKGVTAAAHIVKPGGRILLLAACEEGAGGHEFSQMLSRPCTDREFLAEITGNPVTVDQWQLEKLAMVTTKAGVHYYVPGLPSAQHASAWGNIHSSAEEAIRALLEGLCDDATVAVIPEGPYVLALTNAREHAGCP